MMCATFIVIMRYFIGFVYLFVKGAVVPWLYGSSIYNYLCNRCLSPMMLLVQIPLRARCTTLCDKVCQWLAAGRWFSPGTPVSSTNKTDRRDITEILWKVSLNTINLFVNRKFKSWPLTRDVYSLSVFF